MSGLKELMSKTRRRWPDVVLSDHLVERLAELPAGEAVLRSLRLPGSAYQGAARNDPISAVDGCDHCNIEPESSVG